MTNLFSRVKVLCVLVLMGVGLAAYSATPTVTSLTAQQRYPQNGLVDITVTLQGMAEDVANAECLFVATNDMTKTAIPVEHITRNGDDTGSGTVWTRKFIWDAKADVGTVKIDDVALTVGVRVALPGVQLWKDGPYWAECNVGATQPEESGYYFWWGDTVGYTRNANNDGWISVKDSSSFSFISGSCPTYGKSVSELVSEGYLDSTGNLVAAHDAATAYLGAPWRMPTDAEFKALIGNCTTTWMTRNGVNGLLVSGKGAYVSKSIFLPAAGYGCNSYLYNLGSFGLYWSTAPYSDGTNHAIYLYSSSSMVIQSGNSRSNGPTVRPLRGFVDEGEVVDAVTTLLSLDCRSLAVTASQRYPWNGLVDITVTLQGTAEDVANAECLFAATNGTTLAAIPVTHITCNGSDKYADGVWIRRFVWDAKADVGTVKIDDVELTVGVRAALPGVQLWENGPYWAECNVGAMQPEESGYYFWWGDTVGYVHDGSKWGASDGSSDNFSFYNYNNENPVIATMRKDEAALKREGWIGEDGELTAAHDAATAHLGTPWRMPTEEELSALISNCTTTWMMRNGVNGRLVTGKGAYSAKSIFLPAAGYGDESDLDDFCSYGLYWSSTPYSGYSLDTRYLAFDSDYFGRAHSFRYRGQPVRPVRESANNNALVDVGGTAHLSLDCRGAKVADGTHPIVYDAAWYADGVTVKIAANGKEIDSGSAGFCAWTPSSDGVHLLALNVYNALGAVVGAESVFCLSREDLTDLEIPDGTTEIGERAFAGGGFTSVTIPPSVTNIGAAAFSGCSGLKTATVSRRDYDMSVFPEGCQIVYVGGVDISSIEVFSGWPWKEVVIGYTIAGSADETMSLELTAKDNASGKTYACKTLEGVGLTPGSHVIKWNASVDGAKFKSDDVVFTARIVHKTTPPLYCVVDLSAGENATSYPVSYLDDVPVVGWTDEYKTTKLVLRRIEAGTFTMGSPSNEVGHEENEAPHSVELTKPFYMGIFEVTQKQYQLVMGDNPSAYEGDARPVENISFDMIRGALEGKKWPLTNAVDATSFMGKIRARTGLTFDLPTEAQWEYACRAGTTTALNIGKVLVNPKTQDPGMDGVGRYGFNNGFKGGTKDGKGGYDDYHTTVGSYLPNAWGLYDMHGNVQEWCLDWYKSALGTSKATDPTGPANQYGSRVLRGGSWSSYAQTCRSAFRMMCYSSSFSNDFSGLRLCCGVDQEKNPVAEPFGTNGGTGTMSSMSVAVDTTFKDLTTFAGSLSVAYGSVGVSGCRVTANGTEIVNSTANGAMEWLPSAGGEYKLVYSCGGIAMESTVIAEELTVSSPVITPRDGAIFKTATCTVTIACATQGAEIYYTTNGRTPRVAEANHYKGAFTISDTATIVAVAVKDEKTSEYVEATITKVIPEPLTLAGVLDEPKLVAVATGGDAEWLPIDDATAKVGGSCAVSGALDDNGEEESTWLEAKVYGKGTLTFWWRVNCEPDSRSGKFTYDFAAFEADGETVVQKDGESDWVQVTKTFTTDGEHVIRWIYNTDGWPSDDYDGCVWIDGVTWSGSAAPVVKPTVEGDSGATVTGDAETGFVIKPSEGNTAVEVMIPQSVDAAKVTVEVSVKVVTVKPNGAKVKVVVGEYDITDYLVIPESDGVMNIAAAMVKEEIVKETLDPTKDAEIELNAVNPRLTTAPTRKGLTYTLFEGHKLESLSKGDFKLGDGNPWTPTITVSGGDAAFYLIGVSK